ncbi:hypothetical protein [Paenibacillus medicaginis]|uniref:Uncharacterized protein n=1 Tax=Paenibacillus medicaginis TaxID=1470560 RepID=A0ABV5BUD4_9BACL
MELDRFDVGLPDPQEHEPEEYSACSGCGGTIYCGDDNILDIYGMAVHDTYNCIYKAVEAKKTVTIKDGD